MEYKQYRHAFATFVKRYNETTPHSETVTRAMRSLHAMWRQAHSPDDVHYFMGMEELHLQLWDEVSSMDAFKRYIEASVAYLEKLLAHAHAHAHAHGCGSHDCH